jgi:hypothetical protein
MAENALALKVADGSHLWDKLDGEPQLSFDAFKTFRELPAGKRTVRETAVIIAKNESGLRRWSKKWRWAERAEAMDVYLETLGMDVITMERIAASKRRIKLADNLLAIAEAQLNSWLEDIQANVKLDLTPYEVARIIEIGYKIDRLERGESTDNMAVAIKNGERLTDMTEGQLMERAQCILQEILTKRQIKSP